MHHQSNRVVPAGTQVQTPFGTLTYNQSVVLPLTRGSNPETERITRLEDEKRSLVREKDEISRQLEEERRKVAGLLATIEVSEGKIRSLENDNNVLKSQLSDAQKAIHELRETINALRERTAVLEKEEENYKREIEKRDIKIANLEKEISELKAKNEKLEERLSANERDTAKLIKEREMKNVIFFIAEIMFSIKRSFQESYANKYPEVGFYFITKIGGKEM